MATFPFFRINRPKVIHETIDGEVIIANLDSGNYYSLDKVGADIWSLMEDSNAVGEVVEKVLEKYEGNGQDMEGAVNKFLAELCDEGIIVSDEAKGPENIEGHDARVETIPKTQRSGFELPTLHKYTDMQDLLLLDPIHEVDEMGWPSMK